MLPFEIPRVVGLGSFATLMLVGIGAIGLLTATFATYFIARSRTNGPRTSQTLLLAYGHRVAHGVRVVVVIERAWAKLADSQPSRRSAH